MTCSHLLSKSRSLQDTSSPTVNGSPQHCICQSSTQTLISRSHSRGPHPHLAVIRASSPAAVLLVIRAWTAERIGATEAGGGCSPHCNPIAGHAGQRLEPRRPGSARTLESAGHSAALPRGTRSADGTKAGVRAAQRVCRVARSPACRAGGRIRTCSGKQPVYSRSRLSSVGAPAWGRPASGPATG
jgi:hypothetical protein